VKLEETTGDFGKLCRSIFRRIEALTGASPSMFYGRGGRPRWYKVECDGRLLLYVYITGRGAPTIRLQAKWHEDLKDEGVERRPGRWVNHGPSADVFIPLRPQEDQEAALAVAERFIQRTLELHRRP